MERQRRRNRLRAYGRGDQVGPEFVPAAPVRTHLQQLHDLGLGYERLGRAAGVGAGVVMDLVYGRRGTGNAQPSQHIRRSHAEALLALTPESVDFALVDPTGTLRRLRALIAIGWTETQLATRLEMRPTNFWHLLHGHRDRITATTRDATVQLFLALWQHPQSGRRADRARRIAKLYRWAGPLAWDDVDDVDEQPQGIVRARDPRYTAAEYLDDAAFLLELGESPHQIAVLLDRTVRSILRAAERDQRDDIRRPFERALNKREAA